MGRGGAVHRRHDVVNAVRWLDGIVINPAGYTTTSIAILSGEDQRAKTSTTIKISATTAMPRTMKSVVVDRCGTPAALSSSPSPLAPSGAAGAMGFQGGLWESAIVRVHPTGKVTVLTGSNSHGQGHKTT